MNGSQLHGNRGPGGKKVNSFQIDTSTASDVAPRRMAGRTDSHFILLFET